MKQFEMTPFCFVFLHFFLQFFSNKIEQAEQESIVIANQIQTSWRNPQYSQQKFILFSKLQDGERNGTNQILI